MTGWTAVVPLKINAQSKSRLAGLLSSGERMALIEAMARHVLATLAQVSTIDRIVVLSAARPAWWRGDWAEDLSDTLNAALTTWCFAACPARLLVVHGDLPQITPAEVEALLATTNLIGCALATDRSGVGTNALALTDPCGFNFQFGTDSRLRHERQRSCSVIDLPGLSRDIDQPADLAEWRYNQSI